MKCLQLCPTCRNNLISAQPQGSSLWMWVDRPSANWAVGTVCLLSFQLAIFTFPYPPPFLNLIQFLTCSPHLPHKMQLSGKALIDLFTVRSQEEYCSEWYLDGGWVEPRIPFTEQCHGSFKPSRWNSPMGITHTIFTVHCRWPWGLDTPHVTNRKGNSIKQGQPPMSHPPVASAPHETMHSSSRSQPSKMSS